METQQEIIKVENLQKTFFSNQKKTEVLRNVNFKVTEGETLCVVGPSGAGKSTLLHIIGTLDSPTSGRVFYRGEDIVSWNEENLARFRNQKLGFIFQFHHLLPEFNALENTMMPALIAGMDKKDAQERAKNILCKLGLEQRIVHKQGELSGGEQQRVAVARALIMEPEVVLADEPTGNLDSRTGQEVFDIILQLNRELGITFIIVTHNEALTSKVKRCITLADGQAVERQPA